MLTPILLAILAVIAFVVILRRHHEDIEEWRGVILAGVFMVFVLGTVLSTWLPGNVIPFAYEVEMIDLVFPNPDGEAVYPKPESLRQYSYRGSEGQVLSATVKGTFSSFDDLPAGSKPYVLNYTKHLQRGWLELFALYNDEFDSKFRFPVGTWSS